jgi:hypothetical protein
VVSMLKWRRTFAVGVVSMLKWRRTLAVGVVSMLKWSRTLAVGVVSMTLFSSLGKKKGKKRKQLQCCNDHIVSVHCSFDSRICFCPVVWSSAHEHVSLTLCKHNVRIEF